ncbi:MAG: tetratricopeptide repeat protein [Phycisphaerae bacterium]
MRRENRPGGRLCPALSFPALIVGAVWACYANSLDGVFLLDDQRYIVDNLRIRDLGRLGEVFSHRRPVVDLSLAVNYAVGGLSVTGYHIVNVIIHTLAALTLYGVVRRLLQSDRLGGRFVAAASRLALVVSLLWAVHPLQTQSVTYVTQRGESLMGLFYLLTLYCVIRGASSARGIFWYAAAVACCGLGMGSKGVMVTAPVVVLFLDRMFLAGSFRVLWRRRGLLYGGLALTWMVLVVVKVATGVLSTTNQRATVGFSFKDVTPLEYALTQPGVILRYLWLSVWPAPLCLDYRWPVAGGAPEILLSTVVVVMLFALTVVLWRRRSAWAVAGLWFFAILAPTSSLIPIRDLAFEHRMYLPLAAVMVAVVLGGHAVIERLVPRSSRVFGLGAMPKPGEAGRRHALPRHGGASLGHGTRSIGWIGSLGSTERRPASPARWLAIALVAVAVVTMGVGTAKRNRVYGSKLAMWSDVVDKRPDNTRALTNLAEALDKVGRREEATRLVRRVLSLDPDNAYAHANYGAALADAGRVEESIAHYRQALAIDPFHENALRNLGIALKNQGRLAEAVSVFRQAVEGKKFLAEAHFNLCGALFEMRRLDEAIEECRTSLAIDSSRFEAHFNLGLALLAKGQDREALESLSRAVQLSPNHTYARFVFGRELARKGRTDEAIAQFERVLAIEPDHAAARRALDALSTTAPHGPWGPLKRRSGRQERRSRPP